MVITNKVAHAPKDERWERKFQSKHGCCVFLVVFCFLLLTNVPGIVYIQQLEDSNVASHYMNYVGTSIQLETLYTSGNITQDIYVKEATVLEQQHQQFKDSERKAWITCLVTGLFHMLLFLFIIFIVYLNRDTRKVQNRGTWYLCHLFGAGILYFPFVILLCCVSLNQLGDISITNNIDKYTDALFAFMFMTGLLLINYLCAIINRMHLIYNAFMSAKKNIRLKKNNSCGRVGYVVLLFNTLKWNLLAQMLLYCISIATITYAFFTNRMYERFWPFSSFIPANCVYFVWCLFYTIYCRKIATEYSDFYINIRYITLIFLILICYYVYESLSQSLLQFTLILFLGNVFVIAYALDQFTSLVFYSFKCKEEERLRENQIPDLSNSCYSNDICNSKAVSYPSSCPDPKEDIQVVETELVEIKSSNTNDDIENGVVNDLNKNNVNNDSCNDNRNGDVI